MRRAAFAAAVAAAALTAGPAAARDICVGAAPCAFQSLQPALDAASASPGHDRIAVGAGVWTDVAAGGDIEIDGSGPSTVLAGLRVAAGDASATVRRVRIVGTVTSVSGALTIRDALVDARGSDVAVTTAAPAAGPHTVDLESVTLLGAGGQAVDARAVNATDHVTVSLRDTAVVGFGLQAFARSGAGVANLSLDYDDVFPASGVLQHGAGTLATTAVLHAAPGFAADGFTPAAGSPLIDAATPGAFGIGELDLAGHARLAASGCHAARRDIGAVEASGGCRRAVLRHRRWRTTQISRARWAD